MDYTVSILFWSRMHQRQYCGSLSPTCCYTFAAESPLGHTCIHFTSRCHLDNCKFKLSLSTKRCITLLMDFPAQVVAGFLCSPLSLVWTNPQAIGGPKCIDILKFNYYNAALGIVMDIFLATAPLVVITKLQMDVKRKRESPATPFHLISSLCRLLTLIRGSWSHVLARCSCNRRHHRSPSHELYRY